MTKESRPSVPPIAAEPLPEMAAPTSQAEQDEFVRWHPVQTRKYTVRTPPIDRATNLTLRRVARRSPNCGFVGFARFGKSSASDYVADRVREAFPNCYVVRLIGQLSKAARPRTFCDWVYDGEGGLAAPASNKADPLRQVARRWIVEARSNRCDHVVIVFDEINRLNIDELTWMADITNKAMAEGLRCTSVVFGSPEILDLRTALLAMRRQDLVGRFFSRLVEFDGIMSIDDLAAVLSAYDDVDETEFPAGSGWSFARFFFPRAWERGWRLASEARHLWDAFRDAAGVKPRSSSKLSIGAEYVTSAIEYALTEHMSFDSPFCPLDASRWREAVDESGFLEALGFTYRVGATAIEKSPYEREAQTVG